MALQHLRSSTAHKRPIPTVMSAGQIAINTNEASPAVFFKDSNGDLVKVGPVHIGEDAPNSSPASVAATALVTGTVYQILTVGTTDFTLVGASANTVGTIFTATGTTTGTGTVSGQQGVEKGEMWLDTTGGTYVLKIYDGSAWRSESGTFVDSAGDTMTGALLLDNAASASAPDLSFDGDADTGVYSPGANQVAVATNATGRLFIDSSGFVGIGESSPSSYDSGARNLVVGSTSNTGILIKAGTSSYSNLYFGDGTGSASYRGFIAYNHSEDTFRFGSSGQERLRIDSSGRLLVGASSTQSDSHLVVQGQSGAATGPGTMFLARGSNTPGDGNGIGQIFFTDTNHTLSQATPKSAASISCQRDGGTWTSGTSMPGRLVFFVTADGASSPTERMRIDSSGNVGIGVTSPEEILHIAAASEAVGNRDGVMLQSTSALAADTGLPIVFTSHIGNVANYGIASIAGRKENATSGNAAGYLQFATGSSGGAISEKARIDSSGNVLIGGTTQATADIALNADGSATFAGTVAVGNTVTSSSSVDGTTIYDNGTIYLSRSGSNTLVVGRQTGTSGNTVLIYSDGSATFAGVGTFGSYDASSASGTGVQVNSGGVLRVQRTSAAGSAEVFQGYLGTNVTSSILADGSATFAGTVNLGIPNNSVALYAPTGTFGVGLFKKAQANTGDVVGQVGLAYDTNTENATVRFHRGGSTTGGFLSFTTNNNSEKARLDSSGRLGIGTSSPDGSLHVQGTNSGGTLEALVLKNNATASGTETAIRFTNTTSSFNHASIVGTRSGTGALDFYTAGSATAAMHIDSSSRVGIGTTSPGKKLTVYGTTTGEEVIEINNTSGSADGATTNAIRVVAGNGSYWANFRYTAYSHIWGFGGNPSISEAARIDSSGRLLVGTSTASGSGGSRLEVAKQTMTTSDMGLASFQLASGSSRWPQVFLEKSRGASVGDKTLVVDGDSLGELAFRGADGTNYLTGASIIATVDGTAASNDLPTRLVFSTTADGASSPTERMRIKNSGDVWFNTTTGVIGTSSFGTRIGSEGSFLTSRNIGGASATVQIYGNAGELRVKGDGDCENTNNAYGAISDIKLKENIVDANSQWNDLKALQVRNYNFKAETGYSTHNQLGLIAQEVELVSPGLVGEFIDEETGESTKSINYSVLYMKAVKALQEAIDRIEQLEAKVAALEAQ